MRHCFRISASLLLVVGTALAVQAQPDSGLLTRGAGIPCQIVMGRIRLPEQRALVARSESIANEALGTRETLCAQSHAGQSVIRYESHTPSEHFTLDFTSQGELQIVQESRLADATTRVDFVQPAIGNLRLVIRAAGQSREINAATLWHLLLLEPEVSQERLVPLLTRLRPNWNLVAQANDVEQMLLAATQTQASPTTKRTTALLTSLSAAGFAERQSAYRELRSLGPTLLPQLEQLDQRSFDAEQRKRIAELRTELATKAPDTPQRVARWLLGDQKLVSALSNKSEPTP